jgi:hypothetical protein
MGVTLCVKELSRKDAKSPRFFKTDQIFVDKPVLLSLRAFAPSRAGFYFSAQ